MRFNNPKIIRIYEMLEVHFGFLDWWPGESKLEIIAGAILTQQTSWKNVEKAIKNMKARNMMSFGLLLNADIKDIEDAVKPSGFYRQKAKRLRDFLAYIRENHSTIKNFLSKDAMELRKELLSINGIGKETADSIVLYAAEKPIFVIDAYTKRAIKRIYGMENEMEYDELQDCIMKKIPKNLELYKDFHAQFVELCKNYCKKSNPLCTECPLRKVCNYCDILSQLKVGSFQGGYD